MRERPDPENLRDRLPEVGKRRPRADVGAGPDHLPHQEYRDVLAGVIGARRRRIVAVIGSNDEQVAVAQRRQQATETDIEALEIGGVAGRIVAMAVLRVEVDEVGEDQARPRRCDGLLDLVNPLLVTLRVDGGGDAAAGEEVLDLADGMHGLPCRGHRIEQRESARRKGVVVAVGSAPECPWAGRRTDGQ